MAVLILNTMMAWSFFLSFLKFKIEYIIVLYISFLGIHDPATQVSDSTRRNKTLFAWEGVHFAKWLMLSFLLNGVIKQGW